MTKLANNKMKLVKDELKKQDFYKNYKLAFINKKIRFLYTKVSIIFDSNLSINELAGIEKKLSINPTRENFVNLLVELSKTFTSKFQKLDWNSLGVCFWYVFQTTLFYLKKSKINCEYTVENFVDLNDIKRNNFEKWLKSLYELKYPDFNQFVIKVLELIT